MIEKLIGRFCCNARSCIKVKLYLLQFLTKKKKKTPKRMSSTAVRFGRYSLALALRSEFFTEFRVDANSYFLKNNKKTSSEFTGSILIQGN